MYPLVKLASQSVKHFIETGKSLPYRDPLPDNFKQKAGTFVTIRNQSSLRGCVGTMTPKYKNLAEEVIQNEIKKHVKDKIDVVMSDMAVNTTGIKNIDSIQTGELCKEAMFFAKDQLKNNGYFISKIFMDGTFNEIVAEGKKYFKEVKVFKPKSSRKDSKESFIICSKLK